MAGYWLKLYTDILDDPKYFGLSDNGKLGMIELLLVEKKLNQDGALPSIDHIAFHTRRTVGWWTHVLSELEEIEFVVWKDDQLFIRKWGERQGAVDDNERKSRSRASQHRKEFETEPERNVTGNAEQVSQNVTETVTNLSRNVTESRSREEVETEEEAETEAEVEVVAHDDDIAAVNLEFESSSGLLRSDTAGKERTKWDASLKRLARLNAPPGAIRKAIIALQNKGGYVIAGPWSIVKAVQIEMASARQTVPKDELARYISGPYAFMIQH